MTISIITATYNSSAYIADCISSINEQTYQNIEHIIIDGLSQDNTLEIINKTPNKVTKIVSEHDNGLYDAMNKGITIANGDIIGILNSDDVLSSNNILSKIATTFENEQCDAIFGDLDFVSPSGTEKIIRKWKSSPFLIGSFARGWHPPHPTLYVKKDIYEKYGLFDISLNVSADFELMLRLFEKHRIRTVYINDVLVKMRYGGESTGSIKKIIQGNVNIIKAFKKNEIPISFMYPLHRLASKIKQFFL